MGNVEIVPADVRGLSFSVADLTLIAAWSEALGLCMTVQLDHRSESEEFEEVLALRSKTSRANRYFVWRDADALYVQPLIGRMQRYHSAADAIAALSPRHQPVVTDVVAPCWPEGPR